MSTTPPPGTSMSISPINDYFGYDDEPVPYDNLIADPFDLDEHEVLAKGEGKTAKGLELMSLTELFNLPDPEWLVDRMIPTDSFVTLFGPPGSTKSFQAIDVSLCVAAGIPFHGRPTKQGTVIYIVGEGLRGLKLRIKAWLQKHPEVSTDVIEKNFKLVRRPVRMLEEQDAERFLATVEEYKDTLQLFVLDTWARTMTGGEENSAKDAGIVVDICDQARLLSGCCALVIHHTGADGLRERGSTALRSSSDTSILITQDEESGLVTVKCMKVKDAEKWADIYFTLLSYGPSAVLAETASSSPFPTTPIPTTPQRQQRWSNNNPF